MKLKRKTTVQVGIFVSFGIVLTMAFVFFIGKERSLFKKRYTLVAPFKDVSGLRMGAMVQLAGLNVGFVDGVRFPKDNAADHLEVVLEIGKKFQERIRQDSRASIQTQGLLGDKYILITTGSGNVPVLQEGETLVTEGIGGLTALADSGKEMMEEVRTAAKKFQNTLDQLALGGDDRALAKSTLWNLNRASYDLRLILDGIRNGEGSIGALLRDPALYHDLRALIGHADRSKLLKNVIRATIVEQEKVSTQPVE